MSTQSHRALLGVLGVLAVSSSLASFSSATAAEERPAERPKDPAMQPVEDDPNLPRVLLIGDSISIGYTVAVREAMQGQANVHRPLTNCGPTTRGLAQLDKWLGDKKWDVIHFNFGLHDLKYMKSDGSLGDPKTDTQQVPIDQYEKNLTAIVERLKKTGAKLIWCSTTPVPQGAAGRVAGDEARYNEVAAKIMKAHDIAVDDLCDFAKPRLKEIQQPRNVHFTREGSKQLAGHVAASIRKALPKRDEGGGKDESQ